MVAAIILHRSEAVSERGSQEAKAQAQNCCFWLSNQIKTPLEITVMHLPGRHAAFFTRIIGPTLNLHVHSKTSLYLRPQNWAVIFKPISKRPW